MENWWIIAAPKPLNQLLMVDHQAPPTVSEFSVAHQPGKQLCGCIVTVFHPALQLMPLKLHLVTFVWRSCSSIAYEHSISCCLSTIRSVDAKLFCASARLYFRGTAALLIKALRRVQALSPNASWYCLLKPKEPNDNKHLCCYCLSLSDQLPGRYFQSIPAPLKRKKSGAHPPTPPSTPPQTTVKLFIFAYSCCTFSCS